MALLRSLVYNSYFSVFVVSKDADQIVFQFEPNIARFGVKEGQEESAIKKQKAFWLTQEAFGFTVYRES